MKHRTSLKTKILSLNILLLMVCSLILGFVSIYVVRRLSNEDSENIMSQICEKETLRFNSKLQQVEQAVETVYTYAHYLNSEEFDIYSDIFEYELKEMSISVAEMTDGAIAVYFRYNPEITGDGSKGFFYSRTNTYSDFTENSPTDINVYSEDDVEHVGWYYIPKNAGKAIWMSPYYNQNLNVFMISYVVPYYGETGEFVGVLGMDIDFNGLMTEAASDKTYADGRVGLADADEQVVFYGNPGGVATKETMSDTFYSHITSADRANEPMEFRTDSGTLEYICCRSLDNDMFLFVSVPKTEINQTANRLLMLVVFISLLTFIIAGIIVHRQVGKIADPINRLAAITDKYANGDWSESYICETGDELQALSESISKMAQTTQKYITNIQDNARRDALTGLGNKMAYMERVDRLLNEDNYAVIVMDINLLKKTNDTYGHEMGDILISEAARYISGIFENCAAYRIGGDEFVVILTGDQYALKYDYCRKFKVGMGYKIDKTPDIKLTISYGMAIKGEDGTAFEDIFKIADGRMYELKKQMKMTRTD